MDRPLLLLDVDGVISLFGFDPAQPPAGGFLLVDGIAHFLSATAGGHLRRLAREFELAWCSGWEEKANEYLPLALGLPGPLPHVTLTSAAPTVAANWKLGGIARFVEDSRPLAWVDDCHDDACRAWAADRSGQVLLVSTEPAVGLTEQHVAELLAWAAQLRRSQRASAPGEDATQP